MPPPAPKPVLSPRSEAAKPAPAAPEPEEKAESEDKDIELDDFLGDQDEKSKEGKELAGADSSINNEKAPDAKPKSDVSKEEEWADGTGSKEQRQPSGIPQKRPSGSSLLWKSKKLTGVAASKAKGLRSIAVELATDQTTQGSRQVSSARTSLSVFYYRADWSRSLHLILFGAMLISGCVLLLQRRLNRVIAFLGLLTLLTFVPMFVGEWSQGYANSAVWGLLLSLPLLLAYKILHKLGRGLRLITTTALLAALLTYAPQASAQERVYIPYNPDKAETLKQPQQVFLPYSSYVRMWNDAHPDQPIETPRLPEKLPFYLYHSAYEGRISDGQVEIQAQFLVEVVQAPASVPLGLAGTAVNAATLYRQKRKLESLSLQPTPKGYTVILPEPGSYRIELKFFPQGQASSKRGSLHFGIVPVASAIFRLQLDNDIEINLPDFHGDWYRQTTAAGKTLVVFPGIAERLQVDWYQSSERYRAKGLNITVDSKHHLTVSGNVLQLDSILNYQIISGKTDKLTLQVPKDYQIVSLSCTALERWILSSSGQHHSLILRLLDIDQRNLTLRLRAQKLMDKENSQQIFPEIVPLEADRENGQIALGSDNFYNLIISSQRNLRKIGSYQRQDIFYEQFRYNDHPFELDFTVKRQQPHNFSNTMLTVRIDAEKVKADYNCKLEVRAREIFSYRLHYPKAWTLTKVSGSKIKNWRQLKEDGQNIAEIAFAAGIARGEKIEFTALLERAAQWQKPFALPYLHSPQVNYHSGTILLVSSQDLRVTMLKVQGLEELDIAALAPIHGYHKRYAFRFEGGSYQAQIEVQAQQPELAVDTVINTMIENDWISFGYFLQYRIKFAAADTFKFRLPHPLGEELDILGENIKEQDKVRQGDYWVWQVVLHNKVRERYQLALFPGVIENQGTGVALARITFPASVHQRLCVLVQNLSQYELLPQKVEGVSAISPEQSLFFPPDTSAADFILAYKLEQPRWQLTFAENKQKVVQTTMASIDTIKVNTVVDAQGLCRHCLIYNLRHWGLQFLEIAGLGQVDIWGVFVARRFVRPVKRVSLGGEERLLIPLQQNLTTTTEEERLAVRLIYSQRLSPWDHAHQINLTLPKVTNIREIGQVNWTLHPPQGYIYKFSGNVTRTTLLPFQEYQATPASYPQQADKILAHNQDVLQSAISNTNRLKVRQKRWLKQQELQQQEILNTLQNAAPSDALDTSQINQYGAQNLRDVQIAGRANVGTERIYLDNKARHFAGEANDGFVRRQTQDARELLIAQQGKQAAQVYFYFDLDYPYGKVFHFSKKQGDAILTVRYYVAPDHSKLWRGIQLAGFLLLLLLAWRLKLFSLADGYSLAKFGLTLLFLGIAGVLCVFLNFVHYFYW